MHRQHRRRRARGRRRSGQDRRHGGEPAGGSLASDIAAPLSVEDLRAPDIVWVRRSLWYERSSSAPKPLICA
jgi:hypothetical protein